MRRSCICPCHQEARGNYKDAQQRSDYAAVVILSRVATVNTTIPVDSDDVLEAAIACRICLNNHCPALSSIAPPRTLSEWKDEGFPPPAESVNETEDDGN